jgi:hypothetical protein
MVMQPRLEMMPRTCPKWDVPPSFPRLTFTYLRNVEEFSNVDTVGNNVFLLIMLHLSSR